MAYGKVFIPGPLRYIDTGMLLNELMNESMKADVMAGLRFGRTMTTNAFTGGQPQGPCCFLQTLVKLLEACRNDAHTVGKHDKQMPQYECSTQKEAGLSRQGTRTERTR